MNHSAAIDFPLPTADAIATALQSLPGLFFHRIASRVLEVGIDGNQLMGLIDSIQPPPLSENSIHAKTDNDKKRADAFKNKWEASELNLDDVRKSRMAASEMANHANPSKPQFQTTRDISISSSTQTAYNLPTPEEIAVVLQLGPGKYFQQLASHILEMGIDGKQLKEFIFSFLPRIPMNVIREHILPLLDRVSWNRYCSTYKEIHDASRKMTPPWPYKSIETGSRLSSTVFSPDGGLLACGCVDGIIRIWDRKNGPYDKLVGHTGYIRSLSFSPDGKTLASGSDDRTVRLWRLANNSSRFLVGHTRSVRSVAFVPNGLSLASGSFDGSIRIWDVSDGSCTKVLRDERMDHVLSVAFSPDGATLATAGRQVIEDDEDEEEMVYIDVAVILLWDFSYKNTGSSLLFQSQERDAEIRSIAYSPDGQYIATTGHDSMVRLWNVATQKLQTIFKGHSTSAIIRSVCFSPNGKILASASDDHSVRLWDVTANDGRCLVKLSGHHNDFVMSVVFSPDGRTFASGSYDENGTVRLWNPFDEHEPRNKQQENWDKLILLWNAKIEF
jgi:dipeptidyl aminopeptidase/acylaminoacyl peptidase